MRRWSCGTAGKRTDESGTRTFLLSHLLEVVLSDQRDPGSGFLGGLLLHIDLKVLLPVPEGTLLWTVLVHRRRTLEDYIMKQSWLERT